MPRAFATRRRSANRARGRAPSAAGDARRTRSDRCRYVRPARLLRAGAGTFPYVSNFRAGSWSTTWRVASPTLPVQGVLRTAASWVYGPLRGEFRQSPWFFLLCRSRYSTGDRFEIIGLGMTHRRRSPLICRHGPKRVVRNCQGSWPKATSPAIALLVFRLLLAAARRRSYQARRARGPGCLDPTGWARSGKLFLVATTRRFQP